MVPKEDMLRQRVYKFYNSYIHFGKSFTVAHFKDEGVSKRTIYDILQRFDKGLPPLRSKGSGRKPKILTERRMELVKQEFDHNDKVSLRSAARKFKVSKSWLHEAVTKKTDIKYRKKQIIPDRTELHKTLAKTKCGRLMRKFSDRSFILDDESYFTLSNSNVNGNGGFYTSDIRTTPPDVKFAKKRKFESKVLVWIAIGPKGLSSALLRESGYAINAKRYLNECLRRRLIPYLRENYTENEYVFWPDQASSHYANIVLDYLRQEGIPFVEKSDNPANVPEVRPIERFWAILKSAVYKKGWKAQNTKQLMNRIKYCLKNVDGTVVRDLAESTRKLIDHVRRYGVVECRE